MVMMWRRHLKPVVAVVVVASSLKIETRFDRKTESCVKCVLCHDNWAKFWPQK